MKIVFISPSYYPHIGGVEYVVKSIAERLARLGHEVTVLAGEPNIDKPTEKIINGVKVIRWPTRSPGGAYHAPRRRAELEKLLKELAREADIIHIHSVHAIFSVISGLNIGSDTRSSKLVVTPHYHGGGHTTIRKLLWTYWRRNVVKLLSLANVVHAVSKREASLIANHYPHVEEKIVIIPNGVEEDVFNYKWRGQNSDYMIYAGRIEKYKRLELAIDIAKEMGLRMLIVGRGPYKEKLVKYANKVYRDSVEFLEPQPRAKYLELLSRARYAINPSKHEAFSIFIAEALATGTPAIVSKEVAENLDAETKLFSKGLVVAENVSIKTWCEVVKLYLENIYRLDELDETISQLELDLVNNDKQWYAKQISRLI
mgnify:CR=1 FL=1